MYKPTLDQLRIERKPEKHSSKAPWIILIAVLLLVGLLAWAFWFNAVSEIEVQTADAREAGNKQAGTVLNLSLIHN